MIGVWNRGLVIREVPQGLYLAIEDREILLPRRYVSPEMHPGDELRVFVYRDSEDRPVATTQNPRLTLGEVAWLKIRDVNAHGAFADWGLPKDLLIPFSECTGPVKEGESHAVRLQLNPEDQRLFGTMKYKAGLEPAPADLDLKQDYHGLVVEYHERGWKILVNHLWWGMLYRSEVQDRTYHPGQTLRVHVRKIREDGKLDLSRDPQGFESANYAARQKILEALYRQDGELELGDDSSPEAIRRELGLSKKAFKRALGTLYKEGVVLPGPHRITWAPAQLEPPAPEEAP